MAKEHNLGFIALMETSKNVFSQELLLDNFSGGRNFI
jgi:hypothetical protein